MSKINELQKVKSEIELKENELEKCEKKLLQLNLFRGLHIIFYTPY